MHLLSSLDKFSKRNVVFIIEFCFLVDSKVAKALSLGVSPSFFTFFRGTSTDRFSLDNLSVLHPVSFSISFVETFPALQSRATLSTLHIFHLSPFESFDLFLSRTKLLSKSERVVGVDGPRRSRNAVWIWRWP